ncbi:MAG TPA: hypothetical protein VKS03_11525 [Thermoanaerobaculia bacterium]|nr:hypothetical protein [Thermoanaerobaculia bacterium]
MSLSRRGFRIALLAFVAVSLAMIFLALEHQISHRRWPVKTLADADSARVVRAPVDTTVRFLTSLPKVPGPLPHDRRIAPQELTVYRVRARLVSVHRMLDGDFHVVIADPDSPQTRMIVEIPAPREGLATGLAPSYGKTRRAMQQKGAKGRLVRITGVGFFDYTHWQPGAARNGFELHPVLAVDFLD